MIFAGIDLGSRAIKAVLIDGETRDIVASGVREQGMDQGRLAELLLRDLLADAGFSGADPGLLVATGNGRNTVNMEHTTVTEITCHARGVYSLHPDARTVIDIGGQDSKYLRLDGGGRVRDFVMNDRCAAGTGKFLEVLSERLDMEVVQLGSAAASAVEPCSISSMCVVFAETEINGLLASGETPENIAAGIQESIATRIAAMAGHNIETPVYFTGGVALIPGMARAIEDAIKHPVSMSDIPQMTGALGAALIAAERYRG